MKEKITNILCILAIVAGLSITTFCNGFAAFLTGFVLVYAGTIVLLDRKGYVRNF